MPLNLNGLLQLSPVTWAVTVNDLDSNTVIAEYSETKILRTASVPKAFLLYIVSCMIERKELSEDLLIDRRNTVEVKDAGMWQYMKSDTLPLWDVAMLVGSVSDNLATNALIDLVGLQNLKETTHHLGYYYSRLNDYVRPERRPTEHPATVSQGTSVELARFCSSIALSARQESEVESRVIQWLKTGMDHSMVLRPFGLDPLTATSSEEGFTAWNKTGTDYGVRADIGVVEGPKRSVSYAVIANWDGKMASNKEVLSIMSNIGERIISHCSS